MAEVARIGNRLSYKDNIVHNAVNFGMRCALMPGT